MGLLNWIKSINQKQSAVNRAITLFLPLNQGIASRTDFKSLALEGYAPRKEYSHLKNIFIDLDRAELTDRQLLAISLVFYGGLRKNRAAKIMKISCQVLSDHINAGLKKIEKYLR